MGKKLKRIPYGDAIRRIFSDHIYPLASLFILKDNESILMNAVPMWLNADTRSIWAAKARTQFQMPGTTKDVDTGKSSISMKERLVTRGDEMFIRFDDTLKSRIEIEHKDLVYRMTPLQYEGIKSKIELYG